MSGSARSRMPLQPLLSSIAGWRTTTPFTRIPDWDTNHPANTSFPNPLRVRFNGVNSSEGDPPRYPATVFGGGEDPHRPVRSSRRGQHRRAVPPRGHRAEPLLPLVEGVFGGWQEAPGGRHRTRGNLGRGQGSAPRDRRAEGGGGRTHAREPAAEKKHDRGWGGRRMRYSAAAKQEIIRLVEHSPLPARD